MAGTDRTRLTQNVLQLTRVNRLVFAQFLRDTIERGAIVCHQLDGADVRGIDDAFHLFIDDLRHSLAIVGWRARIAAAHEWAGALAEGDGADALAHAPARDHLARNGGDTLQIVLSAGRDMPDRHLLGGAPAQRVHNLRQQVLLRVVVAIIQRSDMVTPSAWPRGTIVTFVTGSAYSVSRPARAWPPSWYAVTFKSSSLSTRGRSAPRSILSSASSKQRWLTYSILRRAASSAASFTRLARSAPTIPTVARATATRSMSGPRGTFLAWILRIASRPFQSGRSTVTRRSKRPGRKSAISRPSGRLVAAMTTTA